MGLLVAGITGGASLVDTARITSLKREMDEHVENVFIFYSRIGRIPGDLDNSGKIGWYDSTKKYPADSFPSPYNAANIHVVYGPHIDLYLHDISSFKPSTSIDIIGTTVRVGGLPPSKVYKRYIIGYRTNVILDDIACAYCRIPEGTKSLNIFSTGDQTKETVNITKKLDVKFDDGIFSEGNIRGYCQASGKTTGQVKYDEADTCTEIYFNFGIR